MDERLHFNDLSTSNAGGGGWIKNKLLYLFRCTPFVSLYIKVFKRNSLIVILSIIAVMLSARAYTELELH